MAFFVNIFGIQHAWLVAENFQEWETDEKFRVSFLYRTEEVLTSIPLSTHKVRSPSCIMYYVKEIRRKM